MDKKCVWTLVFATFSLGAIDYSLKSHVSPIFYEIGPTWWILWRDPL